jgi:hypothetical protein
VSATPADFALLAASQIVRPACACSPIRDDPAHDCHLHGWWTRDPIVLTLAAETEASDPLTAATKLFGE